MALLLFDIDGTLVRPLGMGRRAFLQALASLPEARGPAPDFPYDGLLDGEIARATLTALGIPPTPERLSLLLHRYVDRLEQEPFPPPGAYRCEGLPGFLDAARSRGHTLALLTGNVRRGAEVKLRAAALDGYFRNGGELLGAFGEDGARREELVAVAMERCALVAGRPFSPEETWVVGDSPRDVEAARGGGVRCAAVATGRTPPSLLRRAGPDLFLESLREDGDLLKALQGGDR
ncbi:MAG: HAD family hydrolase [Acidobacteriota bacterium]